ncbi:MAG: site-specific integrase, partial [Bacteroidota bacterium]
MASVMWLNLLNYLSKLIISFDEYLAVENASRQTRKNYKSDLHTFFTWFCESKQTAAPATHIQSPADALRPITADSINEFKRELRITHTPTATINRRLCALRTFFRYAMLNGWVQNNPAQYVPNIPQPKKTPEISKYIALPPVQMLPSVLDLP